MADFVPKQKESEKKPFKLDTKLLLYITIGLVSFNLLVSYYLFVVYKSLSKPVLPLDVQVKEAIQQQKDLYKMTEKIKKISNGKTDDE
jgi:hypothetical protein